MKTRAEHADTEQIMAALPGKMWCPARQRGTVAGSGVRQRVGVETPLPACSMLRFLVSEVKSSLRCSFLRVKRAEGNVFVLGPYVLGE